ncbi:MAG: segregation and condensation protein A [Hyphomicrobiaceae bacterium]
MSETPSESGGVPADFPAEDFAADDGVCALIVDIDGFEGPLDLLLGLARTQKLDLTHVSILPLTEQYLAYIEEAQDLKLEVAADYLVMAAWLAFLKSKLLLPSEESDEDELTGEELAAMLAFRLQRLEAMRQAAASLMNGKRLGRDVFQRGMPEGVRIFRESEYTAEVVDLLKAYARQRQQNVETKVTIKERNTWSVRDARNRLEGLLGFSIDWAPLDHYLTQFLAPVEERVTAIASTFSATLEMAREGQLEIRQDTPYAPLFVRRKRGTAGLSLVSKDT